MFDYVYIHDDDVVDADLTEPYARLLSDSLDADLTSERKRVQTTHV